MRFSFRKFFFLYFFVLNLKIIVESQPSFSRMMTQDQISIMISSSDYTPEFNGGKCTRPPRSFGQKICRERCDILYSYVPIVQYKNLRFYNSTTKLCQSRPICPSIITVLYNFTSNKCIDISTKSEVIGIDSSPPNSSLLINVTFVCQNGNIGVYNGLQDCICNFGFKTNLLMSFGSNLNQRYVKCNQVVKIVQYIPTCFQIYYDSFLDNLFPNALDPQYWSKALIYYLKEIKYAITTSIIPWQVEIVTIAIPTQPLFPTGSIIVMIWVSIPLFLILIISCYQKLKNSQTIQQIITNEEEENLRQLNQNEQK